jgi:hypothetical protein
MRRVLIVLGASIALLVAGAIQWKADAMNSRSGNLNLPSVTKNYSPIEQVGCYGWGKCPPGFKWKCKDRGCFCKPC